MRRETKNPLVIHLGLVLAEIICVSAFYVELRRALGGNSLSWAYVFEWPIFAAYGVYVWKKLLSDERRDRDTAEPASEQPRAEPADDDALGAYNDYLRRVHGEHAHDHRQPRD